MYSGSILVHSDTEGIQELELKAGIVLHIGRRQPDDGHWLELTSTVVSNNHAQINCNPEGWTLIDTNSKNGTSLNGEALVPGRGYGLHAEDVIQIGEYVLLVLECPAFTGQRIADDKEMERQFQGPLPPGRAEQGSEPNP